MRPAQLVCVAPALTAALLLAGCRSEKGAAGTIGPGGAIGSSRAEARARRAQLTLDNGMAVVLAESHAAPVVAIQAWVGAGAADEPPEAAGAAHLIEHLLRAGALPGQSARELASAGGLLDVWTSFDETVVEATVAAPFLETGLTAVAAVLTNPTLPAPDAADVDRGRKAVVEELKQGQDDPARAATAALFATAFGAHPYGRPPLGSEAAVGALGREPVAAFFRRAYGARNVTLVVAGDFDARAARASVARAFAGVPRGEAGGAGRAAAPGADEPRVAVVARELREPRLAIGFRAPALGHADLAALDLLAAVLGRREGGRLDQELVRNRQLVGAARAYTWSARQAGLLIVDATPLGAGRVEEAARAVLDEALRLGREEIPAAELGRARAALERDLARGSDGVDGYARRIGRYAALAGDPDGEARHLDRVRSLSAEDLREVARKYLRASGLTMVALLPGSGGDRLTARLREVAAAAEARADQRARPPQITAGAATAGGGLAEEPARFVLPSGARVLVLRDGSTPMLSIEALWPGGLRDEDAHSNGASALLADLLARGTKTRSADQIDAEMADMAGTLAGFSGRNGLGLRADLLAQHWERGLELLVDCLRHPSLPDDEVERARRAALDRLRADEDDPGHTAFGLFAAGVWGRHPYRLDPLGAPAAVAGLTRRRLLDHYRRHYGVAGLTVAVVGDVDPLAVAAKLQALLGGAPVGAVAAAPAAPAAPAVAATSAAGNPPPADEPPAGPVELFRATGKEQAQVVLGYPGLTFVDPDRFALAVLAQILGGADGRLPAELRDRRALAYQVGVTSLEGLDPGAFAVHAACAPRNLDAVVQAVRAELARVVAAGVTADEVARATRALAGAQAVSLRWRRALASALVAGEAYGQGYLAYRRYPQELARVAAVDVQRVARRVLDDRRQVVAALRPPEAPAAQAQTSRSGQGGGAPAP